MNKKTSEFLIQVTTEPHVLPITEATIRMAIDEWLKKNYSYNKNDYTLTVFNNGRNW